ncbi:MAG: hypothetical protein ACXW1P_09450 [Methylophilaceae bacterium]
MKLNLGKFFQLGGYILICSTLFAFLCFPALLLTKQGQTLDIVVSKSNFESCITHPNAQPIELKLTHVELTGFIAEDLNGQFSDLNQTAIKGAVLGRCKHTGIKAYQTTPATYRFPYSDLDSVYQNGRLIFHVPFVYTLFLTN